MKVGLLVCAFAVTAVAGPRYARPTKLDPAGGPQVQAAEQAWSAAETETDPGNQSDRWERAALAFGELDAAPVDLKTKRDAAAAAILAWKNALSLDARVRPAPMPVPGNAWKPAPRPLPAREQKVVAAFDRYVTYMGPADADVPGVVFLKANLYRQFDQLDLAIPILLSLIEHYPRQDVAEYAAQLLLDTYNRLQRYDDLIALADQLAGDSAFLRGRDDLARTVTQIRRQSKRKHAEQLESAANASKDWSAYVAAAKAYLAIYTADHESTDNDEVLYNAGVLFEQGRSISPALLAYGLLEKYYPNSRITARAIARVGKLYGDIAMYDKAAAKLEQYAKRYAGEKEAYDAMSDAIYFRKALGYRTQAIADTLYVIKTFGAKKPTEAATASWSLTALYEPDAAATITHLQNYLRVYGAKGGADRIVIAQAKIGALLWKQSCPHAVVDGLCVTVTERTPRTCGKGMTRVVATTKRDETTTKRALAAFAEAVKEFERRSGAFDDPAARYYYAQVKLALADADLEAYLAITLPRGLNFAPAKRIREASLKRFATFVEDKQKLGATANRTYQAVLTAKDAASSITAASRLGTISQTFASELVTSPIPRGPTSTRDAYCDVLMKVVAPLEASAINAFAACLAKSTELAWFGDSSVHCERQLFELTPDEFPRARELRSKPLQVAPVIVVEPPAR